MVRKLIKDFIFNIFSVALPITVLQLFIYPNILKNIGESKYGLIVTLIGVISLFSETFGNILNNTRLLEDSEYKNRKLSGDFNLILLVACLINMIIIFFGIYFYQKNLSGVIVIILTSVLIMIRAYFIVTFRLALDYKEVLKNNLLLSLGYLMGYFVFLKTYNWVWIYFIGNIIALIHLIKNSPLINEPLKKTSLLKKTSKKCIILYISDLMNVFTLYADRLIIYPILGPVVVGYYYAASIMGKIVSMGVGPVSSVILSYIIKTDQINKKDKKKLIIILIIIGIIGYSLAYILGKVLLAILYPTWNEFTYKLLPWTIGIAVITAITSVIRAFTLRFKSEKYQFIINGINLILYIIFITIFTIKSGITGFCIGVFLAASIRLILLLFLFYRI